MTASKSYARRLMAGIRLVPATGTDSQDVGTGPEAARLQGRAA
jgi:hypothetical protein